MKINKYPDGTSYINEITSKSITFKINSYEDLWHLNQYVDAFNDKFGFEPNVTIPCLLDAQADRRFNKGESSGLKLVLKFLNDLPVKKYFIFHPHNTEVVEAMLDNVEVADNSRFIKEVLLDLNINKTNEENLILMSSDAGGFKPLMKLCDKINWRGETYSASKFRSYLNGKSKLIQIIDREDFQGKDILIVDDISVYGGTFKGLSKLLKEKNCGKLYLAVSHMTIQNLGEDPVTNYFDKVFSTNSKFDSYFSKYTEYIGDKIDPLLYDKIEHNKTPENLEIIKLF